MTLRRAQDRGALRFAGRAVLWDRVDRAGDVFRSGAFADGEVPLLWQHRGPPVGLVTVTAEAAGLRVAGEIVDPRLADLVRGGMLDGLSVGYRARAVRQGAWREILSAELVEVSLVAQPMQPGARVTAIGEDQRDAAAAREAARSGGVSASPSVSL